MLEMQTSLVVRNRGFAVNFTSVLVDHCDLEILAVNEAPVPEVLRHDLAMGDGGGVGRKLDADPVAARDAVFHIEEELGHDHLHFGECLGEKTCLTSVALRSTPAFLSAMMRFGPAGMLRAVSRASAALASQSCRSGREGGRGFMAVSGLVERNRTVRLQPAFAFEQGAERQRDLTMLVPLAADWEGPRKAYGGPPQLDEFGCAVAVLWGTSG